MNKAHIKLLQSKYESVVAEYTKAFCKKHGWHFNYGDWVGGHVGEIIEICDRFVDFRDIKTDIDNDFHEDVFAKWYDYTLRLAELGCTKTINYWSYAKGCPLPYSEEHLNAIEKAKRRRDEAEQAFRDCLAAQTDELNFINKDNDE